MFKVGDKIVCVYNESGCFTLNGKQRNCGVVSFIDILTIGKVYVAKQSGVDVAWRYDLKKKKRKRVYETEFVRITNDNDTNVSCYSNRFISLKEYRKLKLEEIEKG